MNKRNSGIDLIRGLCILVVILLHLNIRFGYSQTFLKEWLPKQLFSLLFWSGFYGVVIFFTLSGYLITHSILKKWGKLSALDLKTFYWFRFARIIPLLVLVLLVLSVLHLAGINGFVINPNKTTLARALVAALTFHINWLEIQVGYLPANWDVLWSIAIEESFYLVFPLVALLLKKDHYFLPILLIGLGFSPWARTMLYVGNDLGDKNHFAYLDSIALGCMTAIVVTRFKFRQWAEHLCFLLGLILVIIVLYFRGILYKSGISSLGFNVSLLSLGISLMLIWLHHRPNPAGICGLQWLQQMGKYSYEIYLTHMFAIIWGVQLFHYVQLSEDWLIPASLLILIASYWLGKIIFHAFSEPINRKLRLYWKKTHSTSINTNLPNKAFQKK